MPARHGEFSTLTVRAPSVAASVFATPPPSVRTNNMVDFAYAGPDTVATAFVGMARVGPGDVAYLPVDLTSGAYVAYCLVPDARTRQPHVELGMLRQIRVP